MKQGCFTVSKTNIVTQRIDGIVREAQSKIHLIDDITRYQQLYGNVNIIAEHLYSDSITRMFRNSWFQLNDKLPTWSYPILYQMALKESEYTEYTVPEAAAARDFAYRTAKELELYFAQHQYKDHV